MALPPDEHGSAFGSPFRAGSNCDLEVLGHQRTSKVTIMIGFHSHSGCHQPPYVTGSAL